MISRVAGEFKPIVLHIWQRRVYQTVNKTIKQRNLNNRVEILKAVVNFVRATKRFKTDKGY